MNSMTSLIGTKRPFLDDASDVMDVDLQPLIKQVKTGVLTWESFLSGGGKDVLSKILVYLNARDICSFACAAKVCQSVAESVWQPLRQKEHFDFDWEDCDKEKNKHKWNYRLSAALIQYSKQKIAFLGRRWLSRDDRLKFVKKKEKQFEFLMKRFPSFACYMKIDLLVVQHIFSLPAELNEQRQLISKKAAQWGGESLIHTALNFFANILIKTTNIETFKVVTLNLKTAIQEKNSYISLLVLGLIEDRELEQHIESEVAEQIRDLQWKLDLSLTAAEKGNEHALKAIVKESNWINFSELQTLKKLYDQGHRYYPILATLAVNLRKPTNLSETNLREDLLKQIFDLYGQKLFAEVCNKIATEYLHDKKNSKPAQAFFEYVISIYGQNVPAKVLHGYAQAKFKENKESEVGESLKYKWEDIYLLYQQAIVAYGEHVPACCWREAAYVCFKLNKWEEADVFYKEVLLVPDKNILFDLLNEAAYVKFNLNKLKEAENYYKKAIGIYLDSKLEKLQKRDSWNFSVAETNLFSIYQSQWPATASISKCVIEGWRNKILLMAHQASEKKEWAKACNFYQCLIENFSEDQSVSAGALSNWAKVQVSQKQLDKAEQLYDCAVAAYGESVPVDVIHEAAKLKCALGKWKEGDNFYERILKPYQFYGANLPVDMLGEAVNVSVSMLCDAALAKMYLNQWAGAESLYRDIIARYNKDVPANILHNMANACFNQSKWEEAERAYTDAIKTYGQEVPLDVWDRAAIVQTKLGKWTQAEEMYDKALLKYNRQVSAKVLRNMAQVKRKLGKSKEAKDLDLLAL